MKLNIDKLKKIEEELGQYEIGFFTATNPYLRFGYWKQVDVNKLNEIVDGNIKVVESDDYDEDTGYRYSYSLQNNW